MDTSAVGVGPHLQPLNGYKCRDGQRFVLVKRYWCWLQLGACEKLSSGYSLVLLKSLVLAGTWCWLELGCFSVLHLTELTLVEEQVQLWLDFQQEAMLALPWLDFQLAEEWCCGWTSSW